MVEMLFVLGGIGTLICLAELSSSLFKREWGKNPKGLFGL